MRSISLPLARLDTRHILTRRLQVHHRRDRPPDMVIGAVILQVTAEVHLMSQASRMTRDGRALMLNIHHRHQDLSILKIRIVPMLPRVDLAKNHQTRNPMIDESEVVTLIHVENGMRKGGEEIRQIVSGLAS